MSPLSCEAKKFIDNVCEWRDGDGKKLSQEDNVGYGHAIKNLAQYFYGNCNRLDENAQKNILRERARELIERYGENIKRVMRPELLEALELQDVEQIKIE